MTTHHLANEELRSHSMQNFSSSLPGRILTVMLATLAAAALAYLIYLTNRGILPSVLRWVLVGAIGVCAGFAARFFLPGRILLLQLLACGAALSIGLIFLTLISNGSLGAYLLKDGGTSFNPGWLAPFGLACGAALLVLSSWRRPARSGDQQKASTSKAGDAAPVRPGKTPSNVKPPRTSSRAQHSKKIVQPRPTAPNPRKAWHLRWEKLQVGLRQWWEHGIPDLSEQLGPPPSTRKKHPTPHVQVKRPHRTAGKKQKARPKIQLVGKEEHRCPYCLEEVVRNDPRGVTICPVCRTHHHSDCWAVTGTCQVPHIHE